MPLLSGILAEVNGNQLSSEGALSLERFIEESYFPYGSRQKRPSTFTGYRNMWRCYLKQTCGHVRLRDFRTRHGEQILAEIAKQRELGETRCSTSRIC